MRVEYGVSIDRRSPHGERGLKFGFSRKGARCEQGRSPHGERGLK